MATTEHILISKVIQAADLSEVIDSGIRPDHFSNQWRDVWLWVLDYWRQYNAVPTARAFKTEFADVTLLNAEQEPFAALIDQIYTEYKNQHLIAAVTEATGKLRENDTDEAYKVLSEGLQKASTETARLRDIDLTQSWEGRLNKYEEMRNTPNSLRGIPTGFLGLDRITAGLRPQQLVTFVGEAKKGKSLMTLIMADAAHNHGIVPMYVSFEMSIEEQAARYDAIISGVPHTRIIRGDLTTSDMDQLRKALAIRRNMQPFVMTEDTSSLTTVSALAGKVQQHRPNLLIVDGVYLMDDEHGEPKGSPQALTNITRSLKRLAQRFDIPIIGTTQVLSWKLGNRKTRQITAEAIGYTSSFAQDSDLVLGVESDPDIDNQAIIRVVLSRSSPKGEVRIKWDWDTMDFTEVDEDNDSDNDNWYY